MENDATVAKGLLEPVPPGSVTFENNILAPLRNNYLYEESKECFTYSSAYVIKNSALQTKFSAFHTEKKKNGYSKEELEESFGFLLFDDQSRANKLADTGLLVGQGTCTTLGDSSKGVYISKYSDCLDLKRWYDGKTGYIVLLKLRKGRVKEVTENYTQNFTPPTPGFDCHVSEQLGAVSATTSSFLAFERTQYYMYELLKGGRKTEPCPRHVCPFAIVAFSFGKTTMTINLKEISQEKTSFHYQPWSGQLEIDCFVYSIGLNSLHGAMLPANLPKTIKVDSAIGVSELRKVLPQAIFETSFVGEVSLDNRCFSVYDVVSFEEKNDFSLLTHELKEKDMALVICLDDGGFLVLLHSSHFFSYEGAGSGNASALQGMFIFPDSRTVPRETKSGYIKPKISSEVLQVLPALNYAESEMEKCPPKQQGEPLGAVKKHLQNFATLILPGLSSSPVREASMFPDQYDVPGGFQLIAPKWTEEAATRLKSYLENSSNFLIPVARALELLAAGKQQRNDDDHDDDVYYYISSPEETPRTPADTTLERNDTNEADTSVSNNDEVKSSKQQTEKQKDVAAELPDSALAEEGGTPGTVVIAISDNALDRINPSPKLGDLPEHDVSAVADNKKTSTSVSVNPERSAGPGEFSKETLNETTSVPLTNSRNDGSSVEPNASQELKEGVEVDTSKKENCRSDVPTIDEGLIPVVDKETPKEAGLSESTSAPTPSESQTEALVEDCKKVEPQTNSDVLPQDKPNLKRTSRRRGKRKKGLKQTLNKVDQTPTSPQNTNLPSGSFVDALPEESGKTESVDSTTSNETKKDWRSLPRRKKFWNADLNIKRVLRSDVKGSETESPVQKSPPITELKVKENIISSTPKRKMDGFSMRERYGLKSIVTDGGWMFVPHGSEVSAGDKTSPKETKDGQDTSLVTTTSPAKEKVTDITFSEVETEKKGQHMPLTHIQNIPMNTSPKALSTQPISEKDTTSQKDSDQSLGTDPKKGKRHLYKAISISKLKTVLKRANRTKSPGPRDGTSSDNAEPELKRGKTNTNEDLMLSPEKDVKDKMGSALQDSPALIGTERPSKNTENKQTLSWRELQTSERKLIPKENGCIKFATSDPNEIVKQAGQQPISAFTGDRVEGKSISTEGKSSKKALDTIAPLPDALNLLADLALSVNNNKMLPNPAKSRQDTHVGVKTIHSPETVLHALLRDSSARFKLPPKSPFPEGLLVPEELMMEISKEHSYSQPTSLLSGLSGACPKVLPSAVESLLSLNPKLQLKLPDHSSDPMCQEKGGRNGWRHMTSQRPKFCLHRHIIEKEGLIKVARLWKETYDFRFDSRFTNDQLEKSVTRALHGNWDFNIEDTFEQVHLIFHMWIGLFYSKPTFRFFHFDQHCPLPERKDLSHVSDNISSTQAVHPQPNVNSSSKDDKTRPLHPALDILDLSVKLSGPTNQSSQEKSVENPTTSSDIRPRLENPRESVKVKENSASSHHSSIVSTKLNEKDYRSTVTLSEESSPDDNCSDTDNDKVTDNFYTKPLENKSAYSNLCKQASDIHIAERKSFTEHKNVLTCKGQGMLDAFKSPGKVASGTVTSIAPTAIAVFHQVVRPLRPLVISKTPGQVPERKIILNSLSLKDKAGDGASVLGCSESVPKDKDDRARGKNERTFKILDGSSSEAVACESKSSEMEVKPVREERDHQEPPVDIRNVNNSVKENVKLRPDVNLLSSTDKTGDGAPVSMCSESVSLDKDQTAHGQDSLKEYIESVSDDGDDTPLPDDRNDMPKHNVMNETPMDVNDEEAKAEVKPIEVEEHTQENKNDATESLHIDEAKDLSMSEEKNKLDVGGDASGHNMQSKSPPDVCEMNDNAKNEVNPVNDVSDSILVDVQNEENEPDTPADTEDVNDEPVDIRLELDVSDCTSVDEHDDEETEGWAADKVNTTYDIKEQVLETNEKSTCEEQAREDNESEKTEREQDVCDESCSAMDMEVGKDDASHVSAAEKDCPNVVDMNICVEDSVNETQETAGAFGGEALVEQDACSPTGVHDIKPFEDKERTETSVVINDGAPQEMPNDLSADCENLTTQSSSSPAVDDACVSTENTSESTVVQQHSPVVQDNPPETNQTEHERACSDVSSCTVAVNPESHQVIESQPRQESPKAEDDLNSSGTLIQEVDSSKDLESQDKDTNQQIPKVSEMSADRRSETYHSLDREDVSPPALQRETEQEPKSRSCTPTQDELPYDVACDDISIQGVAKGQDNQSFERVLFSANRSPTITDLTPDKSLCPPSSSETYMSNSGHRTKHFQMGSFLRKYDTTVKENDRSSSFVSEHESEQSFHYEHETITPPRDFVFKDVQPQKDQSGHWFEQYEDISPERLSSRTHGSSLKAGGPHKLREPYACDEASEHSLTHFRNSTSIHRELAPGPREATESDSDIPGWVQQFHYAGAKSAGDKSNERVFPVRRQADVSLSESNDSDSVFYSRKKRKRGFCQDKWDEEDTWYTWDEEGPTNYTIKKTFVCGGDRTKTTRTISCSPYQHKRESKQAFDWRKYFRREGVFETTDETNRFVPDPPSSIITVLDKKGNRVIFENPSSSKRSVDTPDVGPAVEDSFHKWENQRSKSDITGSLMEDEYLIFSEKMNHLLKTCKASSRTKPHPKPNPNPIENPMTIQFSRLDEQESSLQFDDTWPSFTKFKINVDMKKRERKGMRENKHLGKPLHLQSLFCEKGNEAVCSKITDITKECAKSYKTLMNDICTGRTLPSKSMDTKRKRGVESPASRKQSSFCGRIKKAMFDNLHDNLNSVVRQYCKDKYKFYILVTSADPFFEETRDLLEAEGHTAVEPYQFDIDDNSQTPLLIVLRNEDIAEHICEVPHLLELKKSSRVMFAGIDRPDDVVNLTHQELFAKGGFVVFDESAMDALSLENMKKVVSIMEELDKKGKWKWFLHYRDSRKLRENARCSPEAQTRKNFMDCCQEAGIVEVLPYHECDVISRDRPDYVRCLVRLQVQNAFARFPVFITDTPAESFGENGILTMNIYTFSRILSNDTCSIS